MMKQNWEMCTTAELVKISRGTNGGLPTLIPATQMTPQFRPMPFQPLQIISTQPGGHPRMLGPAIIPRLPAPNHRLPIRTLSPMPHASPQPMVLTPAPPPVSTPIPPSSNTAAPPPTSQAPKSTPKFQVQANAVNVPDSVRKSMAPPPSDDPENFKVPPLAQQKQQHLAKHSLTPSRHTKFQNPKPEVVPEVVKPEKPVFNGLSCLPSDLLDDQDADDQAAVTTHHPPTELLGCSNYLSDQSEPEERSKADADKIDKINKTEFTFRETAEEVEAVTAAISTMAIATPPVNDFPAPIGSGRTRGRNRNSQTSEEIPDFDFLNSISNDWSNMTKKLTPEQISSTVWAPVRSTPTPPAAVTVPVQEMVTIETQTENAKDITGAKIIVPTGSYKSAPGRDSPNWNRKTIDCCTQVLPEDFPNPEEFVDPYQSALGDLCELFPNFSPDELEYFLTQSAGCLPDAIDRVIEATKNTAPEEEFAISETVLETYNNENEEMEFLVSDKPVTIQDQKLFDQLIDRFGPPEGVTRSDVAECHGMFAAIPIGLAKQIYDWWMISMMDPKNLGIIADGKMAKALADEEMAHQMQREWNSEISSTSREHSSQEFPPLSENLVKVTATGDWTRKNAVADQIKMTKLSELFPSIPAERLKDILKDNFGSMEDTIKTICHLVDKDPKQIQRIRINNARSTKTSNHISGKTLFRRAVGYL